MKHCQEALRDYLSDIARRSGNTRKCRVACGGILVLHVCWRRCCPCHLRVTSVKAFGRRLAEAGKHPAWKDYRQTDCKLNEKMAK